MTRRLKTEASCMACGQHIRFVWTQAGKAMPLDPDPSENGNVAVVNGKAVVFSSNGHGRAAGHELLYLAHFVTCVEWKRRKQQ